MTNDDDKAYRAFLKRLKKAQRLGRLERLADKTPPGTFRNCILVTAPGEKPPEIWDLVVIIPEESG